MPKKNFVVAKECTTAKVKPGGYMKPEIILEIDGHNSQGTAVTITAHIDVWHLQDLFQSGMKIVKERINDYTHLQSQLKDAVNG